MSRFTAWVGSLLPQGLRPVTRFHYRRLRGRLDPELPLICAGLGPGSVALDVGANDGLYTHAFARTGARVEAFEPQPRCLPLLRAYASGRGNVRVHDVALGAAEGEAVLHVPVRHGQPVSGHASIATASGDGERHRVRVRTLDAFAFGRVDALKIDVEGLEYDVVLGARETIRRCRPRLLVEIEQRHMTRPIAEVFGLIVGLEYDGSFADAGGMWPLSAFELARHQRPDQADAPGGRYVNNFLFTPR